MRQLSGVDASFLHMEDSRVTGHVAGLVVLDPSTADGPITADTIRQYVAERLPVLPPLRWRLVEVPLGIDLPYWYDDHDLDMHYHVRGIALPAPGNHAQLVEQVSRIHSRPLDRNHPLWELYVIEGLEGGKVAILTKLHHAAVDGKAGMKIMSTLLSLDPKVEAPPKVDLPDPGPRPSDLEMWNRGWMNVLTQPGKALELMTKATLEWQKSMWESGFGKLMEAGTQSSAKLTQKPTPRLSFNKSMTARRNFAFGTLSLSEVKAIKDKHGCTINDIVMTLCTGAMRRWLIDHDELPEDPIRAMVPVSIRTSEQADTAGNQVSAMVADLPTHLADPAARLASVRESMKQAKEDFAAVPATLLQDFSQFAAPAASELIARTAASLKLAERVALPFNLVISNVPGPRVPLYYNGALVEANYPVSMISDGMCLNITVQSYRDNLDFGLISCPEHIPDLDTIIAYLREELAVLSELSLSESS